MKDKLRELEAELQSVGCKRMAELLDVHEDTLVRWRIEGYGPPWFKSAGSVRYRLAPALRWVEANEAATRPRGSETR